jgi:hypothetical protein
MEDVSFFKGNLIKFTSIWCILRHIGIFCGNLVGIFCGTLVYFKVIWYIFPVLVYCTSKIWQPRVPESLLKLALIPKINGHFFTF